VYIRDPALVLCCLSCSSVIIIDIIRLIIRGVQYVHWVMHKCIMVKVGGEKIKRKHVKSGAGSK